MKDLEHEKVDIPKPLGDDTDYGLWNIRVTAALEALGLARETMTDASSETTGTDSASPVPAAGDRDERHRRACALIIRALSDAALCVVRDVINDPVQMMVKLDARYDNKPTAAKISKMSELVSIDYTDTGRDIRKHIDKLAGLVAQLKAMKTSINDTLAVGIIIASIKHPALAPVTAAIKTLADKDITWDGVAASLIEARRDVPRRDLESVYAARDKCGHCGRHGHTSVMCRFPRKSEKTKRGNGKKPKHESSGASSAEDTQAQKRAA